MVGHDALILKTGLKFWSQDAWDLGKREKAVTVSKYYANLIIHI